MIVFNQRSLVACLWVAELVRTEGWRAYRGRRLTAGLRRCICTAGTMECVRNEVHSANTRGGGGGGSGQPPLVLLMAVGYLVVLLFGGRFIKGSGFTSVK